MRLTLIGSLVVFATASSSAFSQTSKIDLRTKPGVETVKGEWRYSDVKIIEVDGKGPPPENKPLKLIVSSPALRNQTSTTRSGRSLTRRPWVKDGPTASFASIGIESRSRFLLKPRARASIS